MHVRNGLLRNAMFAVALVTLALPAAALTSSVTPTHAQTPSFQSSINTTNGGTCAAPAPASPNLTTACYVEATPGLAFNVLGTNHTVTFTCSAGVGPNASGVGPNSGALLPTDLAGGNANALAGMVPGCYDVSASITDESGGAGAAFTTATCGDNAATLSGSTVNCASYASPLCPYGATTLPATGAFCTDPDANAPRGSQMRVTINPGAPHAYLITFTGYTPLLATCSAPPAAAPPGTPESMTTTNGQGICYVNPPGTPLGTVAPGSATGCTGTVSAACGPVGPACPAGFTLQPGPFQVTTNLFVPPFEAPLTAPDGVCQFSVSAEKKYVEITSLTLTPTGCSSIASPASLVFSEGLKAFFGPSCTATVLATGVVILKSGVNCATEPNGTTAPGFPAGSKYSCTGDTLSVIIPNIGASTLNSGPIPVTVTGSGSAGVSTAVPTPTLGGLCTGVAGAPITTGTGASIVICPTGPGTGTVTACTTGGFPDSQPQICATPVTVSFVLPNVARVVPYVRWAGEKQVLTKCFGGSGFAFGGSVSPFAGALVDFTLEGAGSNPAQATLIPASLGGFPGSAGGSEPTEVDQNGIITTADAGGCATVIVYAAGEGVVNVDAAIYSNSFTTAGTVPLVNEHAFEIFYLKYDHIDLENIKFNTTTATTLTITSLGFTAASATFSLPSAPGTNPPGANGYTIPLCGNDYLRALVHGYFEMPGDPSGRPATTVSIPGAVNGAVGSYVLPAGRWVLPEDWPVLATFAGFNAAGAPAFDNPASSVFAWDLNSGWVFNPGGENADLCAGPTTPPATNAVVSAGGVAAGGVTASGGIDNSLGGAGVSYGPCVGVDAAGTVYTTAPAGPNCTTGVTTGIGPFDITQGCTNTISGKQPLTYAPAGSWGLAPAAGGNFALAPISTNSTYLPNGTLNEWDAPMPAAQVSFGITGGPGFLNQVNKTGLYSLSVPITTAPSGGTCPAGTTINGAGTACNLAVYPNPFYSEAIPASPLIPPVTNNGGYLWNTYGFSGGTTIGTTVGAGFLAGATTTAAFPAGSCAEETAGPAPDNGAAPGPPQGFTFEAANSAAVLAFTGGAASPAGCYVGTAGAPDSGVTSLECASIHGHFIEITAPSGLAAAMGLCWVPPAPATAPGGINLTNFGAGCPATMGTAPTNFPAASTMVEVADITGFTAGDTVTVFDLATGNPVTTLTIASAAPGPDVVNPTPGVLPTTPGTADNSTGVPGTLTFTTAFAGCLPIYSSVFVAGSVAVTVPSTAAALSSLTPGTEVDIITPAGTITSGFISSVGCTVPGAAAGTTSLCFSGGLGLLSATAGFPAGTLLETGPTVGTAPVTSAAPLFAAGGQGPYPFWQWLPNPAPTQASFPRTATVYSDNHGEAVVSLETGVAAQVAPTNGACPANYVAIVVNGVTVNCELNFASLGVAATTPGGVPFQGIAGAGAFTAAAPGCGTLNPATGTFTAAPAPTASTTATPAPASIAVVGGSGPSAGQICINNLGGIEFGAGAVLGTTTVQAIADYPYVRGLHAAISSGAVTKIFTSLFNKSVTVTPLPGGVGGPSGTTAFTVTITGTDICGNPIAGEPVNVFALGNAGAVVLAPFGPGTSNGTNSATVFLSTGTGAFTGIPTGTATLSLEVLSSAIGNGGLVLKVVFPLERVERFVTVIPGSTGPTTTQQLYPPGYSQVGGPAGTNFGAAEQVFAYNAASNSYTPVSSTNISSAPPTCQGYWAFFANAASVSIPVTSKAGDTATCNLAAGWNLVGNPFASNALLPAGVTAYHWNGTSYDTVSAIPLGGAVWIFETAATTVTLTAT